MSPVMLAAYITFFPVRSACSSITCMTADRRSSKGQCGPSACNSSSLMKSIPPSVRARTISAVAWGESPTLGLIMVPINGRPYTPVSLRVPPTPLAKSLEELSAIARRMIEEDEVNVIIVSDRGVNRDFAPVPSLLAIAGLHHYLIREGLRTRVSLVLETGEAREVHHFSLLIGYACRTITPYLAFETIDDMIREGLLVKLDHKSACKNFVKAATKGVIKVMSKMGISAIQSYRGAQVFEALGLRQDVIDQYFTWTPSRVGGIGLDVIAQEVL